jgi:hypothetical protein
VQGCNPEYNVDVATLITVAIDKFLIAFFTSSKSLMPIPKPTPIIGPIKGEINIAPIITAVEFTFKPMEAIKMANIKVQRLAPLNSTFS